MIENSIKAATCRISCGDQIGTGWLITPSLVITARHCITEKLDDEVIKVELTFPNAGGSVIEGQIKGDSAQWDTCLISLSEAIPTQPIPLKLERPCQGESWETFGFPIGKTTIGHRAFGQVLQLLKEPAQKIDVDLAVEPKASLKDPRGLSGAVVICEGAAVGLIRIKVDSTIGALSLSAMKDFLETNGVNIPPEASLNIQPKLAERDDFTKTFTDVIIKGSATYIFLEGAHGYGKSTFCEIYQPASESILNLGSYHISNPESAMGPEYRAQPQVFLEWLTDAISMELSGQPAPKQSQTIAERIKLLSRYLKDFSDYCAESDRQGLLFIDGLNEIPSENLLIDFVALLPTRLPQRISIVLVAPNFTIFEGLLSSRVKRENVISLPALSSSACYQFCHESLKTSRRSPDLIDKICQKANGHALYLRYLIEYANNEPDDIQLEDFPVIGDSIADYYHGVWSKLLTDEVAINLLALIARLRWGIPVEEFTKALTPHEQSSFVSVIRRIRHLLVSDDRTSIYHSSFADFIKENTVEIDTQIQKRLAGFCHDNSNLRYCCLNRIYHLLNAKDTAVFTACDQDWFDNVVTWGIEPDTLIADVDTVTKRASLEATPDDIFRLLLLAQRINFRYDTLFAQSANSIAEALITLGRPQEALQHICRLNTLIVHPHEALEVAYLFHRYEYDDEAHIVLDRLQQFIVEAHEQKLYLHPFLELCSLHIRTILLDGFSDLGTSVNASVRLMSIAKRVCTDTLKKEPSKINSCLRDVNCQVIAFFITFIDEYIDYATIRAEGGKAPESVYFEVLCATMLQFETGIDQYQLIKHRDKLEKVFDDLEALLPSSSLDENYILLVADTLIRFGASSKLVNAFIDKAGAHTIPELKLVAENGVDVDHEDLQKNQVAWRNHAFSGQDFNCPRAVPFLSSSWQDAFKALLGALYWCDGKIRRADADEDAQGKIEYFDILHSNVIERLRFPLNQRATWPDSYSIPENALPIAYRELTELLFDCYPVQLINWLSTLTEDANDQWGMYSEGFRKSVYHVIDILTRNNLSEELELAAFELIKAWRDHTVNGIENRHELIPEILRMIPFFSRLGATEEAEKLYQFLLSVSMGPTWYKEDQLEIMTKVMRSVPVNQSSSSRLPIIAGLLDKASGEMTFQRYIRAEKTGLLGQIVRLGKYHSAIAYYRRQCCGSREELWNEAHYGKVDNVGPFKGSRYPGGALDDQAAMLELVRHSKVDWTLRWAILEIFHCGDDRHLSDYGEAYAEIVNEVGAIPEIIRRANIVTYAETSPELRKSFASAFRNSLNADLHGSFAHVLKDAAPEKASAPNPPVEKKIAEEPVENKEEAEDITYFPGVFGKRKSLNVSEDELAKAQKQKSLGNRKVAKSHAVEALKVAQEGGWDIWGHLTGTTKKAEEMLNDGEKDASSIIRYYAPLLDAEQNAPRWMQLSHLIGKVGPVLSEEEILQTLDTAIDHVRLIVGDASEETESFKFLSDESQENEPSVELVNLIVWLCDHPQFLRRNRAAAMLLWLSKHFSEFDSVAVKIAFSMAEGFGPDVLCGIYDGLSTQEPTKTWNRIEPFIDQEATIQELKHASRISVLYRLANRASKSGSESATKITQEIRESALNPKSDSNSTALPTWASCLSQEWNELEQYMNDGVIASWDAEMQHICAPRSITEIQALENAVSVSFRERDDRALNRWESIVRFTLNKAFSDHVSMEQAQSIEAILRIYNPSLPDRETVVSKNDISHQLMAAIESGNYSDVLLSDSSLILSHNGVVSDAERGRPKHLEVLCLLQPNTAGKSYFAPNMEQYFHSSECPSPRTSTTPFEICSRLRPQMTFFGSYTPAMPLPYFQKLTGTKETDFDRMNWRYGRVNQLHAFGRPTEEGCSLSLPRDKVNIPSKFKLTWLVWVNGHLEAFVDQYNNSLM